MVILLFVPSLSLAQTATSTNPHAALIASLESLLQVLEAEIQQILANQATQANVLQQMEQNQTFGSTQATSQITPPVIQVPAQEPETASVPQEATLQPLKDAYASLSNTISQCTSPTVDCQSASQEMIDNAYSQRAAGVSIDEGIAQAGPLNAVVSKLYASEDGLRSTGTASIGQGLAHQMDELIQNIITSQNILKSQGGY